MKALLVIDYTHDFVDGALPVGEPAVQIERALCDVTEHFVQANDYVVFAVDLHELNDAYHPEARLFPPHNIKDTAGRDLYGDRLKAMYETYQNQIYWMDKTRYSAFCGTDLDQRLAERNIKEIHLVGVCTDICVLHTAVDAYNRGYNIVVYEDAVASFNQTGHEWALQHFQQTLGAKVVTVNSLLKGDGVK